MVNRYPAMMFSLVESPTLEKFQGTDVLEPKIYLTRRSQIESFPAELPKGGKLDGKR